MKQRVHLARGLVGDPGLLLLDEPTTGMDPVSAREFRAEVLALRAEGRTVLLATHDMREAAAVCDGSRSSTPAGCGSPTGRTR